MAKPNRTVRDSVFRDLFSDTERVLQLYKYLHPEDKEITADDISIITLQQIVARGIYDDLSFLVRNTLMVLIEAQTEWQKNILFRFIAYYADLLKKLWSGGKINIYSDRDLLIPEPEFIIVYTGEEEVPDEISLHDMHPEWKIDISPKVIKYKGDGSLIDDYIRFCRVYSEQLRKNKLSSAAIEETLRICENENVLQEYLTKHRSEVIDIMERFDQDYVNQAMIAELGRTEKKLDEAKKELSEKTRLAAEKECVIREKEQLIDEKEQLIEEKDLLINEYELQIRQLKKQLAEIENRLTESD